MSLIGGGGGAKKPVNACSFLGFVAQIRLEICSRHDYSGNGDRGQGYSDQFKDASKFGICTSNYIEIRKYSQFFG